MMKKAKEYLNERTAEIDAVNKKLAIKAWFYEFFEGLKIGENANDNLWLVTDNYGVQFDITLKLDRVEVITDYKRNGLWEEVNTHYCLYCESTTSELIEQLTTLFCDIVPNITQ